MASRTYIQMYVKLNRMGKLPMPSGLRNKILYASDWLDNDPEMVESIVQHRIGCIYCLNKLFCGLKEIGRWNILALEYTKYCSLWEKKMQRN